MPLHVYMHEQLRWTAPYNCRARGYVVRARWTQRLDAITHSQVLARCRVHAALHILLFTYIVLRYYRWNRYEKCTVHRD